MAVGLAACGGSSAPGEASPGLSSSSGPSQATGHCPESAGLTGALDDRGTQAGTGSTVAVGVGDSYFEPTCITGVPPGTVTLTMKSTGSSLHNISVPDQAIDIDIPAGQTVTAHVTVGTGPLRYFCKYHRTSGMQAALLPAGR
jgi:plastocyanin